MVFDINKFQKTKYEPRIEKLKFPVLKDFFPDDEEPVWVVRGLTGVELGKVNYAAERNKNMSAIMDGLLSNTSQEQIDSVRKLVGLDKTQVPDEIAKRLEMFILGSIVDGQNNIDIIFAVSFSERFPIEFTVITNTIIELTGQGQQQKKK